MPRTSEKTHQRQSPRVPLRLKPTACSEANSIPRVSMERSSKIKDGGSPRTVLHEKKRGSRVVDLETKLDQTMEDLKKLKEQLASAEVVKKVVQEILEKTKKAVDEKKVKPLPVEKDSDSCITTVSTDICEVAVSCSEENGDQLERELTIEDTIRAVGKEEEEVESKLPAESPEMAQIGAVLAEKEKELEILVAEKESLKKEAEEAKVSSSIARKKTEEMEVKLAGSEEELRQSKAMMEQLKMKLETEESVKASMEAEMKRLKIQTDQWRKASEAAASILAAGDESFRSVKKPLESFDLAANGDGWSPMISGAAVDEGLAGQKRRGSGSGLRSFGELWKKKGQHK